MAAVADGSGDGWQARIEAALAEAVAAIRALEARMDGTQAAIQTAITAGEAELNRVVVEARQQFVATASSDQVLRSLLERVTLDAQAAFRDREAALQSTIDHAKARFEGIDRRCQDAEQGLHELRLRIASATSVTDPWAQASAAAAASAPPAAAVPLQTAEPDISNIQSYRVNNRDWGDKRLDLVAQLEG